MQILVRAMLIGTLLTQGCASYPYRILDENMESPGLVAKKVGTRKIDITYISPGRVDEPKMLAHIKVYADELCGGSYEIGATRLEEAVSLCDDGSQFELTATVTCAKK